MCPTLCNPMDCGLPGSSVHGIFQARVPEWAARDNEWKFSNFGENYKITILKLSEPQVQKLFLFFSWKHLIIKLLSSVQFSCSVVSDSLQPHEPQHARPFCPLPTPRVYPNSCPLSRWCHSTISSSVIPFFSHLQSFPASGSKMSQLFASGGQNISTSASVLPMNIQDSFPLRWTGWICLQSKGLSRVFSNTTVQKHQFFGTQPFYSPALTSIHDYWENHSLD